MPRFVILAASSCLLDGEGIRQKQGPNDFYYNKSFKKLLLRYAEGRLDFTFELFIGCTKKTD